jgi:hypothetical protein
MSALTDLVSDFVDQLSATIEADVLARARVTVEAALGNGYGNSRRLPAIRLSGRPRKKPPIQLCPVPGCRRPAAPVFGMVCSEHKNVSKVKIRQYREARRAKAAGRAAPPAATGAKAKRTPEKPAKAKAATPTRRSRATPKRVADRKRAPAPEAPATQAPSAPAAG